MIRFSSGSGEVAFGILALAVIWLFGSVTPSLSGAAALWIAGHFFFSGLRSLRTDHPTPTQPVSSKAAVAPVINSPTLADKMESIKIPDNLKCPSCGANILPTDRTCNYCGSSLVPLVDLPQPAAFGDLRVGQSIRLSHPKDGELTLAVRRRLFYGELWQEQPGPNVPWTTTGTYYVGLSLDRSIFLLNWQSRFFLLDSSTLLSDKDINRDFAPHARQFAASNQTANISFRYGNATWKIDDIGRFRIEYSEGGTVQISTGSIGRFIHASSGREALVVEDYQSGGSGGLDTLWRGFLIAKSDIQY